MKVFEKRKITCTMEKSFLEGREKAAQNNKKQKESIKIKTLVKYLRIAKTDKVGHCWRRSFGALFPGVWG